MTTTPALYACRKHPAVRAELHIPATVSCARCGQRLRPVENAQNVPPEVRSAR